MSIPAVPTLLMVVGGIALIVGRWAASSRWYEAVWFVAVLGCGGLLMAGNDGATTSDVGAIWLNDPYSVVGQWLSLVFGALFGVGSFGRSSSEQRAADQLGFLSFAMAGAMLVAGANDLVTLALAAEIVQFSAWGLRRLDRVQHQASGSALDSTNHTFWIGVALSCSFWLGIALIANVTGATQFDEIRSVLVDAYSPDADRIAIGAGSRLGLLGIGLVVAGLGGRLGLVPWHIGLVEGISNVRYWTAGCIVVSSQLVGALGLGRLTGMVLVGYRDELLVLLLTLAGLTALVAGSLTALSLRSGEGRLRRWVTSLVLLQAAWLTLGLMTAIADLATPEHSLAAAGGQPGALAVFLFGLAANLLVGCGAFLWLSYFSRTEQEVEFCDELLGLGKTHPVQASVLLVLLGSAIGHPPLWGFWANWLLMVAGLNVRASGVREHSTPHAGLLLLLLILVAATILTAATVIQLARLMLLEQPLSRQNPQGKSSSFFMAMLCAALLVVVGLFPARLLQALSSVRGPAINSSKEAPAGSNKGSATAMLLPSMRP